MVEGRGGTDGLLCEQSLLCLELFGPSGTQSSRGRGPRRVSSRNRDTADLGGSGYRDRLRFSCWVKHGGRYLRKTLLFAGWAIHRMSTDLARFVRSGDIHGSESTPQIQNGSYPLTRIVLSICEICGGFADYAGGSLWQ